MPLDKNHIMLNFNQMWITPFKILGNASLDTKKYFIELVQQRERCNFDCGNFWKAGKAEAMIATKQTPAKKNLDHFEFEESSKKWNWFLGKWASTFVLGKLNIVAESWKVVHLLQNKGLRLVLSLSNKGPLAVDVATGPG